MEKSELLNILGEKYNKISKIGDEIKELLIEYGANNTKFRKGDRVTTETLNNNYNVVLMCTGEFDYSYQSDNIYVECEIVTTNTEKYKNGTFLSIPEKYLNKINNG